MKNSFRFASVALLALTASTAQAAGEGRFEVRGGVATASASGVSASEGVLGVGFGYDFDISKSSVFIGVEGGVDRVMVQGADLTFSVGTRVGAKLGDATRLFATGGYGFNGGDSSPYLGVGAQQKFGGDFYGKVEFRRAFDFIDVDYIVAGFGMTF